MKKNSFSARIIAAIFLIAMGSTSYAQLKGTHLLGDYGLNAGTQTEPSIAVVVPAYWYDASKYINSDGDKVGNPNLTTFLTGAGVSVVAPFKILKANWGASLLIPFVKNRIDGNMASTSSSLKFSDIYVQPIQLGWHTKRADFTAGYGLYIPTGKFELGADDNTGLGMWAHEFSLGSTLYFDKAKSWHLSTIAFYELNSKKKGTDVKAGDLLTLEGGLGRTYIAPISAGGALVFDFGAIYYAQFKVTDDDITVNDTPYSGSKDRVYGLGLQGGMVYSKTMTSLSFRWVGEFDAKNRFEGNTFFITLAQVLKMFDKK